MHELNVILWYALFPWVSIFEVSFKGSDDIGWCQWWKFLDRYSMAQTCHFCWLCNLRWIANNAPTQVSFDTVRLTVTSCYDSSWSQGSGAIIAYEESNLTLHQLWYFLCYLGQMFPLFGSFRGRNVRTFKWNEVSGVSRWQVDKAFWGKPSNSKPTNSFTLNNGIFSHHSGKLQLDWLWTHPHLLTYPLVYKGVATLCI